MPFTAEIISELECEIPGYNEIPLTLKDFEETAERHDLIVSFQTIPWNGWLLRLDGLTFVIINKNLRNGHKAFVGFHEFFHHKYHPGDFFFYEKLRISNRVEYQASTMASLAIMPTPMLIDDLMAKMNVFDLGEKYDVPRYIVEFRLRVYKAYRQLFLW